jgi:hypothetical protein
MEYAAAIALAISGAAIGVTFRLRFLLGVVILIFASSLTLAASQGLNFKQTLLLVVIAQGILQVSYFVGLVVRPFLFRACRKMMGFSDVEAERLHHNRDV